MIWLKLESGRNVGNYITITTDLGDILVLCEIVHTPIECGVEIEYKPLNIWDLKGITLT